MYSEFGTQSRLTQIDEIRAGGGSDVIDLTSPNFAYIGDGMTVYGGSGDDVIWSNTGSNILFGDAGDDRITGGSGDDVIIGGSGNDKMHGGGGEDIFCFGGSWGNDVVEQLAGGKVVLHFENGSMNNWDAVSLTYTDGSSSVRVRGVDAADITISFAGDISVLPDGAFAAFASEKIFETNSGIIA